MAVNKSWNVTIDYVTENSEWEATIEEGGNYGPSFVAHNVFELLTTVARELRNEVGDDHHLEFTPKR